MDEHTARDLAHEALDYLRSWHDGDTRFGDRLERLRAYVAALEVLALGYTVGPYTGTLPLPDLSVGYPILSGGTADDSRGVGTPQGEVLPAAADDLGTLQSEVSEQGAVGGELATTTNTFVAPVSEAMDIVVATPEEVIAQAEALMKDIPQEIGGKKKSKH